MREISLKNYKVKGIKDGQISDIDYNVKESLISILFHPQNQLNGKKLLERDKLARRIDSSEDNLLLEETEYRLFLDAIENLQGFGRNDVELVRRIIEAEEVTVEKKDKIHSVK